MSLFFLFFKNLTRNSGLLQFLQEREIFLCSSHNIPFYSDNGGAKKIMTDNLKVKAGKVVGDARVAAHAVYDDATVAAHNTLKSAGKEAQKVSEDVQIGVNKAVADAKIAVHETESRLKKGRRGET